MKTTNNIVIKFYDALETTMPNVFMLPVEKRTPKMHINIEKAIDVINDKTSDYYHIEDVREKLEATSEAAFKTMRRKTSTFHMPIGKFLELWNNGIIVTPKYQRNKVKTNSEKSNILGIVITNHQSLGTFSIVRVPGKKANERGAWELWDGYQRFSTIADFLNEGFRLSGTGTSLDDCNLDDLKKINEDIENNILNSFINIEITHSCDYQNIVTMFSNKNACQTKMTKAEDIHARYGDTYMFNELNRVINNHPEVVKHSFTKGSDNRYSSSMYLAAALGVTQHLNPITTENTKPFTVLKQDTCNSIADRFLMWAKDATKDEIDDIIFEANKTLREMSTRSLPIDFCKGFSGKKDKEGNPIRDDAGHKNFVPSYRRHLHSNATSMLSSISVFTAMSITRPSSSKMKNVATELDEVLFKFERSRTFGEKYIKSAEECIQTIENIK